MRNSGHSGSNSSDRLATDGLVVIYDADCSLCTRSVETLRKLPSRAQLHFVPIHEAAAYKSAHGLTDEELAAHMHVIEGQGGTITKGADGIIRILCTLPNLRWLSALHRIPGMKPAADFIYRTIARHRYRLFGKTDDCSSGTCRLPDKSAKKTE